VTALLFTRLVTQIERRIHLKVFLRFKHVPVVLLNRVAPVVPSIQENPDKSRAGLSITAKSWTPDQLERAELYRKPRCRPLPTAMSYLPCRSRKYIAFELLGREAGCRISLCLPGAGERGAEIAATEKASAATCIATIAISQRDPGFASHPVEATSSRLSAHASPLTPLRSQGVKVTKPRNTR